MTYGTAWLVMWQNRSDTVLSRPQAACTLLRCMTESAPATILSLRCGNDNCTCAATWLHHVPDLDSEDLLASEVQNAGSSHLTSTSACCTVYQSEGNCSWRCASCDFAQTSNFSTTHMSICLVILQWLSNWETILSSSRSHSCGQLELAQGAVMPPSLTPGHGAARLGTCLLAGDASVHLQLS